MLIVDTGVLVAATDRKDPAHAACAGLLTGETGPLITTGMVIAVVRPSHTDAFTLLPAVLL